MAAVAGNPKLVFNMCILLSFN